jgi:uncharacterized protein YjbI with pentapeptide repeats
MFLIVYISIENPINAFEVNTHNISEFQDPPALVEKIVAELRKSFPEPGRTIERLGATNFILISTLPSETRENKSAWLFPNQLKMNTLKFFKVTNIALQQSVAPVNVIIHFESKSESPYGDNIIENRDFTDPAFLEDLQANGAIMTGLNTPDNNLNGVIFDELHYIGAFFTESQLIEASFYSADLVGADFANATLQGANFYDADLRKTNFYEADLTPALKADGTSTPCVFSVANLKYANLTKAKLNGADLAGADLRGAILTETDLTGCNMQGVKLYGTNWQESKHDADLETEADFERGDDYVNLTEDTNAELAETAAAAENAGRVAAEDVLAPLELDLEAVIPGSKSQHTYNDIVQLLLPKINSVKMPLSAMKKYQWYGIASLGTTPLDVWARVGLVDPVPAIGMRFKCINTTPATAGEAQVYESGPDCMAIHELVRDIDIGKVLLTFRDIVGTERLQAATLADDAELLNKVTQEMYQLVVFLLGYHLADEEGAEEAGQEAWTRYYNMGAENFQKRSQLVKHAIYHKHEGLIVHPLFEPDSPSGTPDNLLIIIEFLKTLPRQVQVAWAQNYIKEFITGYGQTLKDFDPLQKQEFGFIASCINGNFEKMLMAIRTAIVQFAHTERPPEYTDEERNQDIRNAVTGSVFEKYFAQERDPEGPTIARYREFIDATDTITPELKGRYLSLLEEPEIIRALEETINVMSGGRRSRRKAKTLRKLMSKMKSKTKSKKSKSKSKSKKKSMSKTKLKTKLKLKTTKKR